MIQINRDGKMQTKITHVTVLLLGETKEQIAHEIELAEKQFAANLTRNYVLFLIDKLRDKKEENQIEKSKTFFQSRLSNKQFELVHLGDFSVFKQLKTTKANGLSELKSVNLLIPQVVKDKNVKKIIFAINPSLIIGAKQNGLINFDVVLDVENSTSDKIYNIFNNYLMP